MQYRFTQTILHSLTIERQGHYYHWHIRKPDQHDVTITIDRENANQY
ncbi:hypothetical protein [Mitsuokella multacida]|nr:hypothetical protein [Mitsuokella multacida]